MSLPLLITAMGLWIIYLTGGVHAWVLSATAILLAYIYLKRTGL